MEQKRTRKYYISTEGQTEKLYFEHLQRLINFSNEAKCKVNFSIKTTDPKSFVKRINILTNVRIYHIFDVEATDHEYTERFKATLKNMKDAEKLGKNIKYISGYSNLTFEI